MVKVLFTYDTPTYRDKNGIYCSTTLTNEILSRYTYRADVVYVATRIKIIDNSYSEVHLSKIDLPKIKFVEIPNFNVFRHRRAALKRTSTILKKLVDEVDLIYLRLPGTISSIAAKISKKIGKHYFAELGGCPFDSYWNYAWYTKPLAIYSYFDLRKIMSNASYASYVTNKWLQHRYPCNCPSLVSSNVRIDRIDNTVLLTRKNRLPKGTIVLGTAAAVNVKYKGQGLVIKALSILKKSEYPLSFRYELAGDGDHEYLKNLAIKYNVEDIVIFRGRLTHTEILSWLDNIDVYIQPSLQEGLPRAIIEAMSRACPVIGSTTAGIPELLDEDCLFERGKVFSIVRILKKLDPKKFYAIGVRNFEKSKFYEFSKLEKERILFFAEYIKNTLHDEIH